MSHMLRAVELARGVLGTTSPNPAVGAVLVKDGRVVGEGATQPPGKDHAEIVALKQAGDAAKGGSLYVSLEPCNHHGRTPPCTESIIKAGVTEVHFAVTDSNPKVNGSGAKRLKEAGIKVVEGEEASKAGRVTEAYAKHVKTGLPFVVAKYAMSLDGKIATRTGESRWITGLESRRYAHKLREESDGVMVGAGTVQKDDPSLTARDADDNLLPRQPLRIVVDSHGRIPPASKLLTDSGKTLVALSDADESVLRRLLDSGVEVQRFLGPRGLVDLDELMGYLGKRGVMSLIAEGGGILLGAMFDARLVDKVIAQMAPAILGGRLAPTPVQGDGISRMEDALRLKQVEVHQLGDDVTIVGYCG